MAAGTTGRATVRARVARTTVLTTTATTRVATTAATTVAPTTPRVVVGPVATDPTTDLRSADAADPTPETPADDVAWRTIASPGAELDSDTPLRTRRVVAQLALGIVVVLAVVTIGGAIAARRLAEREAVNDAANIADVFAESVIRPQLTDRLAAGNAQARQSFDGLVRAH